MFFTRLKPCGSTFQRVFAIPPLKALQEPQRHLFHFLFHPDFPMRARSTFNDQARKVWQVQASLGIHLFKHSNILYQFESWYQDLIERFSALADFRAYWEREGKPLLQGDTPSKIVLSRHAETSELLPIQLQHKGPHEPFSEHAIFRAPGWIAWSSPYELRGRISHL